MFCPSCGKQSADATRFCISCGKPLPVVPPALFATPPMQPPLYAMPPKKPDNTVKILVIVIAAVVLGVMLIGFAAGVAGAFASNSETTDEKVARLMREAAGVQPVKKSLFREDATDTKMRDFFRDLIQLNKEYQAAIDKQDMSESTKLTLPEYFADPALAAEGLRQLHAAYDIDAHQEERLQQINDNFRHQFDDLPSWEREIVLKGFDEGIAKSMPQRQRATSAEKAYVEAMDDLYNYAESHHPDFELRNGHLVITNDAELQEFNSKIHTLNASRREFVSARDEFSRFQGQTWQKMGMSRQDAGLQ